MAINMDRSYTAENTLITPELLVRNGYQYASLIGEGSNGKTYRAFNQKTGEIVAIKALKFSDNLKNYELFRREAEVLSSIHEQGVPRYDAFITQGDAFTECWLVQEFVDGDSLLDLMEKGRKFDEFDTLIIMRKLAHIVRNLQTKYVPPIIHRDIKPSNILLQGNIKDNFSLHLIDFGAVANPQKRSGGSTVAGTVGYMAPEQLLGDCAIQSDYYAIGATALHLITGVAPCDMPSDGFTLHFEEILHSKCPDLHPKTLELFQKLLASRAMHRPVDATELVNLIDTTLAEASDRRKEQNEQLAKLEKKLQISLFLIVLTVVIMVACASVEALKNVAMWCAVPFVFLPMVGLYFRIKVKRKERQLRCIPEVEKTAAFKRELEAIKAEELAFAQYDGKLTEGIVEYIDDKKMIYTFYIEGENCACAYCGDEQDAVSYNASDWKEGDKVRVRYHINKKHDILAKMDGKI